MLVKEMTFDTFDGKKVTKKFYFNLTKAEVAEMEVAGEGGSLSERIKELTKAENTEDNYKILAVFKDFILKSYGVKSEDGLRFIKNKQLTEEFAQTNAYSDLFYELASDADVGAAFIAAVLPKVDGVNVAAEIEKAKQGLSEE